MKAPKYGNHKVTVNGETFDSKKEYNRYLELFALQQAGKIAGLRRQIKFELIPTQRAPSTEVYRAGPQKGLPKPGEVVEHPTYYIADFAYYKNGEYVVEDSKGVRTKDYVIKRKLMLYVHGIRVLEV